MLIDTAGLRHRRKVKESVDVFSMSRTIDALQRCDVAIVLLDATQGVTRDDQRIVSRVCRSGCGFMILVNKWDLIERAAHQPLPGYPLSARSRATQQHQLVEVVRRRLPFASFAPVLAISAKTGFQVARGSMMALRIARAMRIGCSDAVCLEWLQQAWAARTPPRLRGRMVRLQQVRCLPERPIRLEMTTSPSGGLPLPYQRYLLKALHADSRLAGVPVQLVVNPTGSRGASRRGRHPSRPMTR
jgi:GTP-binding protein